MAASPRVKRRGAAISSPKVASAVGSGINPNTSACATGRPSARPISGHTNTPAVASATPTRRTVTLGGGARAAMPTPAAANSSTPCSTHAVARYAAAQLIGAYRCQWKVHPTHSHTAASSAATPVAAHGRRLRASQTRPTPSTTMASGSGHSSRFMRSTMRQ